MRLEYIFVKQIIFSDYQRTALVYTTLDILKGILPEMTEIDKYSTLS